MTSSDLGSSSSDGTTPTRSEKNTSSKIKAYVRQKLVESVPDYEIWSSVKEEFGSISWKRFCHIKSRAKSDLSVTPDELEKRRNANLGLMIARIEHAIGVAAKKGDIKEVRQLLEKLAEFQGLRSEEPDKPSRPQGTRIGTINVNNGHITAQPDKAPEEMTDEELDALLSEPKRLTMEDPTVIEAEDG